MNPNEIPHRESIRTMRMQAERTIAAGKGLIEQGEKELARVADLERARAAFDQNADLPAIESATGEPCVCLPGWGHRSDGPHPRERVIGCDTNRANGAVGGASDYINEMLIAQRGRRLTELL